MNRKVFFMDDIDGEEFLIIYDRQNFCLELTCSCGQINKINLQGYCFDEFQKSVDDYELNRTWE